MTPQNAGPAVLSLLHSRLYPFAMYCPIDAINERFLREQRFRKDLIFDRHFRKTNVVSSSAVGSTNE